MKVKKRLTWILVICIVTILFAGLAIFGVSQYRYYADSQENQYLLKVSVGSAEEADFFGPLPAGYTPGRDRSVSFQVSNSSYIPVQVKEVLVLSVYDPSGTPVFLDGSPYTDSSVELRSDDRALVKALEGHRAVYVSEYALDAGTPLYENRSEWEDSPNSAASSNYSLITAADSPYADYILRLDLFLYGKPQAYPYANWQFLSSVSSILENPQIPAALESQFSGAATLPVFSVSQSYRWELFGGKALLVDAENLRDPNAVIPEKIWLSETPEGYVEDPIDGICYDVAVKGNAFYDNKTVQTVFFRDGVSIACNTMWDGRKQGMFEGCTALTAVSNIPDGVISMEDTFRRCTSLTNTPQLPASVEDLTNCFYDCTALQEASSIPAGVTVMAACFRGCSSLKETPVLPEGLTDLSDCFYGCTVLETVSPLPASVTTLDRTFTNCSSLTAAPVLPDGLKSMAATFFGCTKLVGIPNLPESVFDLTSCFKGCTSLETIPEIPSQALLLDECFYGCTNLTGTITLPADVFAYSDYIVTHGQNVVYGCESLDAILVDGCPKVLKEGLLSTDIPIRFTKKHTRGTCESCHIFSDTLEINGLTVVMDNVPEVLLPVFIESVENVHEDLIPSCKRLTFTSNWTHGESFAGIYYWDSKTAYIRIYPFPEFFILDISTDLQSTLDAVAEKYTTVIGGSAGIVIHELAHGYDRHSTSSTLSNTAQWRALYKEEGRPLNPPSDLYAPSEFREEAFARAVARYFTDPESLKSIAPGIYAYLDERFGEAA